MPRRKSTGLTDRSVVSHGANGKGDASRITDVKAYRANYDEINWGEARKPTLKEIIRYGQKLSEELLHPEFTPLDKPLKTLRELEAEHEWRMGL